MQGLVGLAWHMSLHTVAEHMQRHFLTQVQRHEFAAYQIALGMAW